MEYSLINISVHLMCFMVSFYALSCLKFERICDVSKPAKAQLLLILLALGVGYLSAQFLLTITIFN